MSAIKEVVDIDRSPEDVYAYAIDPLHIPEWQASAVSARRLDEGPLGIGSRVEITRHVGRSRTMPMTMEVTEYDPPRIWGMRGIDGPVRGNFHGTVEPLGDGRRSRVTMDLDFEGHGLGKVLVPLIVRPQIRKELPQNERQLKDRLEHGDVA